MCEASACEKERALKMVVVFLAPRFCVTETVRMGINSGAGVIDRLILSLRAKTLREIFDIYATCEKKFLLTWTERPKCLQVNRSCGFSRNLCLLFAHFFVMLCL